MVSVKYIYFSFKRIIQYRANLISWILADFALYSSLFLSYYFLRDSIDIFGDYTSNQMLLYISGSFIVNNLYAVFFAEAIGEFYYRVIEGNFIFDLLKPTGLMKLYIFKNFNFPAAFSTLPLLILNYYCIKLCSLEFSLLYWLYYTIAAILMGVIFLTLFLLILYGLRSEALSSIFMQLMSISERPDTVFPKIIRSFFVYIIPVFMFSAIPTRIILGIISQTEILLFAVMPIIYLMLASIIYRSGLKRYESGVE